MSQLNEIRMTALGHAYGLDVAEFLRGGGSLEQAQNLIENAVLRRATGRPTALVDELTLGERNSFSFTKIIRHLGGDSDVDAGLEREISNYIAKRRGKTSAGFYVPTRLRSGLDTKSGAAGAYTVATEVADLIALLRNKTKVIRLGATVLTGLDDAVAFPVQATGSVATWVGQNPGSDLGESDSSFSQKGMMPKLLEATTSYSRQLLKQSSLDVEGFVRNDLAAAHAVAIDSAAINGSGLSNQPTGILQTSGVGSVVGGTNGALISYAFMTSLQDAVFSASGDVDDDRLGTLASTDVRKKLQNVGVLDSGSAGVAVWSGNMAAGWRAEASKNVPNNLTKGTSVGVANAVIFGFWPAMVIGEWGVMEILVDPFKLKKQNILEVTSYSMVDILVQQAASFSVMKDALVV